MVGGPSGRAACKGQEGVSGLSRVPETDTLSGPILNF